MLLFALDILPCTRTTSLLAKGKRGSSVNISWLSAIFRGRQDLRLPKKLVLPNSPARRSVSHSLQPPFTATSCVYRSSHPHKPPAPQHKHGRCRVTKFVHVPSGRSLPVWKYTSKNPSDSVDSHTAKFNSNTMRESFHISSRKNQKKMQDSGERGGVSALTSPVFAFVRGANSIAL